MGEIDPWDDAGAARRGERGRIVGGNRIVVEREPVSEIRKAVRKIESTVTLAGVFRRGLVHITGRAEVAPKDAVRRERAAPPTSTVRVKPNSRFLVGLKLIFSPWKYGAGDRRLPWRRSKKASHIMGPRKWPIEGSSNGETRSMWSMRTGDALSEKRSAPPSSGLHHRLSWP